MANTQLKLLLMSVFILVTQTTKGVYGVITLDPLNRVVYEEATNTNITCGSTYTNNGWSQWGLLPFYYPEHSGFVVLMPYGPFIDHSYADTFAIEYSEDGIATLVVFNATISPSVGTSLSTAGIFFCGDMDFNYRGAHLVVIRTDPICSKLQSGDAIQLSCTIVYGSYREHPIDAVMNWTVNGQPIPSDDNVTFTINSSPTEVTASSTLLINNNFDATYECETTFSKPAEGPPDELQGLASGLATNAPDYLKTWTISVSGISTTSSPTATAALLPSTTTTKTLCAQRRDLLAKLP